MIQQKEKEPPQPKKPTPQAPGGWRFSDWASI